MEWLNDFLATLKSFDNPTMILALLVLGLLGRHWINMQREKNQAANEIAKQHESAVEKNDRDSFLIMKKSFDVLATNHTAMTQSISQQSAIVLQQSDILRTIQALLVNQPTTERVGFYVEEIVDRVATSLALHETAALARAQELKGAIDLIPQSLQQIASSDAEIKREILGLRGQLEGVASRLSGIKSVEEIAVIFSKVMQEALADALKVPKPPLSELIQENQNGKETL